MPETRLHIGEYVILTQPCLGVPAQSVGVITRLFSTDPPHYLIHFGVALPDGPFPQTMLSRLRSAHTRHQPGAAWRGGRVGMEHGAGAGFG